LGKGKCLTARRKGTDVFQNKNKVEKGEGIVHTGNVKRGGRVAAKRSVVHPLPVTLKKK